MILTKTVLKGQLTSQLTSQHSSRAPVLGRGLEEEEMIDISKFDKGEVLAALYNAAKPIGLGLLHYDPKDMTKEEAEVCIVAKTYEYPDGSKKTVFDYLKGRVIKVDLSGHNLDTRLYDRDNGEGAAQRAIDSI